MDNIYNKLLDNINRFKSHEHLMQLSPGTASRTFLNFFDKIAEEGEEQ